VSPLNGLRNGGKKIERKPVSKRRDLRNPPHCAELSVLEHVSLPHHRNGNTIYGRSNHLRDNHKGQHGGNRDWSQQPNERTRLGRAFTREALPEPRSITKWQGIILAEAASRRVIGRKRHRANRHNIEPQSIVSGH